MIIRNYGEVIRPDPYAAFSETGFLKSRESIAALKKIITFLYLYGINNRNIFRSAL